MTCSAACEWKRRATRNEEPNDSREGCVFHMLMHAQAGEGGGGRLLERMMAGSSDDSCIQGLESMRETCIQQGDHQPAEKRSSMSSVEAGNDKRKNTISSSRLSCVSTPGKTSASHQMHQQNRMTRGSSDDGVFLLRCKFSFSSFSFVPSFASSHPPPHLIWSSIFLPATKLHDRHKRRRTWRTGHALRARSGKTGRSDISLSL